MTHLRFFTLIDSNGNEAEITDDGQLHVVMEGKLDTNNTTTTPLGIGGVYTGTGTDISRYSGIGLNVTSDQASATNGLCVFFSKDGSTWFCGEEYTVGANSQKFFTPPTQSKYYRIQYTNGAVAQTTFDLHVMLRKSPFKWSSHNISDPISSDDDAELVKSVLTGEDPTGIFNTVSTTVDGDLKISNQSSGLSIAKGDVTGATFIHKFGEAPDFDSGDGAVTVWDGANDSLFSGSPPMVYTYSTSADIGTISSSSAGDTVDIEIQGLDTNYDIVTQTVTLTGQADALLPTNLIRVFRMKNIGSTDLVGIIYLRTNGSGQTTGVPNTANTVRAIINNGNNQTLMSIYTIPNGKTGYMRDWYAAQAGANRSSGYKIRLRAMPFGQVFQLKHTSAITENGSSYIQHQYEEPEVFEEKTDIEMTVATTDSPITGADVSAGFDMVLIDN
jgi:hypothetical protein